MTLGSCAAGPQQLYRSVDDWDNEMYVEDPWLDAALYVIPVIPIAKYVAILGDFFIVNAYHFWFHDIWDREGTGFEHYKVDLKHGKVKSLMIDDAKFLTAE